jgi:16S rRNA (uracil1498-N3)-methyltransferase
MSTRVFVDAECAPGTLVSIPLGDVRHLRLVLRLKAGDEITIVSDQKAWQALLETVEVDRILARITKPDSRRPELPNDIILLQAIPKGNKMDAVIEKVTELGASRIVPIICERSYGRQTGAKLERWRRIASAAAAQSQRVAVPEVDEAIGLSDALERFFQKARLLVAWEQAPAGSLPPALRAKSGADALAVVIGPEGSFTDSDLNAARRAGAHFISLGATTLRTETAAAAAIAAICALRGWW